MKTKFWLIICALFGALCFWAGRTTSPVKEVTKLVKGETIRDSIDVPVPVKEYVPTKPELKYVRDTIYTDTGRVIIEKVDTAAIILDYITKRTYNFNVFNNEYGRLDVDSLNVQYNQLTGFYYSHTPIQKVITRLSERTFTPFLSMSYSSLDFIGIGGGLYIKNLGLEYQFLRNYITEDNGHLFGIRYKF